MSYPWSRIRRAQLAQRIEIEHDLGVFDLLIQPQSEDVFGQMRQAPTLDASRRAGHHLPNVITEPRGKGPANLADS